MEIVVGALAAWGVIMLFWTLLGVLYLPLRRRDDTAMTVVLQAKRGSRALERYLKGLVWLRNTGFVWWDIVVITDGLTMDELEAVDYTAQQESHVHLVGLENLTDWMVEEHEYEWEPADTDSGNCGGSSV